jgi:hypothetical protein
MSLITTKIVLGAALAILLATSAQKSSAQAERISYASADMKILGVLNYGQTSQPVDYSETPEYRAFVFSGHGNDRVEVTVTGGDHNAFIAVADPSLQMISSGTGKLSVTLPDRGPDEEGYYVVFKDRMNHPARLSLQIKKIGGGETGADSTR